MHVHVSMAQVLPEPVGPQTDMQTVTKLPEDLTTYWRLVIAFYVFSQQLFLSLSLSLSLSLFYFLFFFLSFFLSFSSHFLVFNSHTWLTTTKRALTSLESDKVLCDALGPALSACYLAVKRKVGHFCCACGMSRLCLVVKSASALTRRCKGLKQMIWPF
jgi:hypothetical protein